ncbi:NAD(P)-binding protein [Aureobasidium pullulans]|nr:NAD(P)-binding protein [Aureobasidium pullulans]
MVMTVLDLLVHPVVVGLVVIVVASGMMGFFSSKQHFPVEGRTVLLTGGSSGMGRALARKLAEQGANVCIVARNQQKLDETIDYIKSHAKSPNQRFLAISADCTSATENTRILDETTAWNNSTPPDIIWANAGSSSPGLFIDTPLETHRAQMGMNYWSSFYLAHASLKLWLSPSSPQDKKEKEEAKRAEPRHFIITSSVVAFVGLAGYTPYAPAKAALKSLADSLRMELNLYSGSRQSSTHPSPTSEVKIHLVCPATILSPGYDAENETKHAVTKMLEEDDPKQTSEQVAEAALEGLRRGDYVITTQWLAHAMRVCALGGSPRNGWGVVDVLFGWVMGVAWLFIAPVLEGKVWRWGRDHGCASA